MQLSMNASFHSVEKPAQLNFISPSPTAYDVMAIVYHKIVYYQRPQPRTVYYPVRTNCANPCPSQSRYRYNYRPVPNCCPQNVRPSPSLPMLPPNMARPAPALPSGPNVQPKPLPSSSLPPITNPPVITSTLPTPPPERPVSASAQTSQASSSSKSSQQSTTLQQQLSPATVPSAPSLSSLPAVQHTDPTPQTPTTMHMRPERKFTTKSKYFNPCQSGKPLMNEFDTPISCNYLNQPNGGCPEDYFCHTGASFATTACCPKTDSEERCNQRRDTGEGDELVARWYFDKQAKQCRRFLYKGIRGNANNFVTKAQCMDACENTIVIDNSNPCRFNQPARYKNLSRIICGPNDDSMCPKGYYCHIGENPEMTVCCESSGLSDPCLLSINVGQGKALIKRFYYNTFSKRCTEFIYKGTKGNENNFLTYADCQEKCQKWSSPCPSSSSSFIPRRECSMNGTECSSNQWCHIGKDKDSTVCCSGAAQDSCVLPLNAGEGAANLTRWYVDPNDRSCNRQCKSFTYNGAKGNQNNFLTKALCEQKCKRECKIPCGNGSSMLYTSTNEPRLCSPTSPCPSAFWCHVGLTPETTVCCSAVQNTCELPMEKGTGSSHLTRWHFDKTQKKCVKFIYSGEGGNQNMFLTLVDCQSVCPVFENPCGVGKPLLVDNKPKQCSPDERCPSTHFCHLSVDTLPNYCCPKNGDPCEQDLSSGTGGYALTRYFYDRETRRCREFSFHGLKGNANNFLSQEDCELVCPGLPFGVRRHDSSAL
ncbi:hypothetical protein WR25_03177 isoform B [Diploscapter pachys]|uniref:BPTI/Kunitz inhibitor domain-containing protein n=1 Tax=Diploscapter pachys TaxID=2018661 RepID=A0A2A2L7N7_9BILA|nr:hypothetical protein WR25_03177 isoform B [Diploscapter pachys]